MKRFDDKRGLPVCYLTDDGKVLLDDETADAFAAGDYTSLYLQLPNFDMEYEVYRITGQAGLILPKDERREAIRNVVRKAIGL